MKQLITLILTIAALLLASCGGRAGDGARDDFLKNFAAQFPAEPLTCTGTVDAGGGEVCDEADGKTYYKHFQRHIGYFDASKIHGTFSIGIEDGIAAPGLYQIVWRFPEAVGLTELTLAPAFNTFRCPTGEPRTGVTIAIDGYRDGNPDKVDIYAFSIVDPPPSVNLPPKHYDSPVFINTLVVTVSADLCGRATVKPEITATF